MTEVAELTVVPWGPGWLVDCSIHGRPGPVWTSMGLAGFDAIGHAAAFHSHPTPAAPTRNPT
jgi:hypothetical protein